MESISLEFLKKQTLFKDLTEDELVKISTYLKRQEFESNDSIFEEEDTSTDIYLIEEGEVAVLKWDEPKLFQLPIGKMVSGDMFGEMSFLDASPRSATVEARKQTVLYTLNREDLEKDLPDLHEIFYKIFTNIATINVQRLRSANQSHVKTLRTSVYSLRQRIEQAIFLITILLCIALFNFVYFIPIADNVGLSESSWSWICWIVMSGLVCYVIKKFHYYIEDFGFNLDSIKQTLKDTSILIAIGAVSFYFLSQFFTPAATPEWIEKPYLILLYLGYCVAYEFIGRGLLVTAFGSILKDVPGWKSIGYSALIMTFIPIFNYSSLNLDSLAGVLAGNLFLGKIFHYQKNLVGVVAIHFILGLLANYLGLI